MRFLTLCITMLLTACVAEDKKNTTTNDQGQSVTDATLTLSGFWNGQFDATTADSLRVLIYNGNVYGRDAGKGYYGTVTLNDSDQTVLVKATSYLMNSASDAPAKQLIADGASSSYELDTQVATLTKTNDSLFGSYSIDSTPTGNLQLTRDGTWDNNSPLSGLIKAGKWTATNHELVMTRAGEGVTFTGISTSTAGCNFRGRIENLDTNYNLYSATLTERENCPAFNNSNVSGFAGFNKDNALEFYFRNDNSMLFMTFTPPAEAATDTSGDGAGDGTDTAGDGTDTPDTTTPDTTTP